MQTRETTVVIEEVDEVPTRRDAEIKTELIDSDFDEIEVRKVKRAK